MSFSALVLAGSRPGEQADMMFDGVAHKALIRLQGQPLLQRVVQALRDAGAQPIAVSCDEGPVAELARALGTEVLKPACGPSGSVFEAFSKLGAPLVITTADHALLQPEWITALVEGTPQETDISVMLANRDAVEAAMPGSRRTYLRFADGDWSGCNLFYLRTHAAENAIRLWQTIEVDRKRPWRIATRLGFRTLYDYALGRLALSEAIARLGATIDTQAALVHAPHGLAAVDIDRPQDLADIKALLGEV